MANDNNVLLNGMNDFEENDLAIEDNNYLINLKTQIKT